MAYKIERFKPHFLLLKQITVSAGATEFVEGTFSDDLVIKHLLVWASDGSDLYDVFGTITIEDETITHDSVPLELFNTDLDKAIELNWTVRNGEKIKISVTNNKATDVTLNFILVIEK